MNRAILHISPDNFFTSVERLNNSSLAGKSVVVTGGENGAVISCSNESRVFGVCPAMPAREARRLAPHAIFLPGNIERYDHHSDLLTRVLADAVPVLEKVSHDGFYADLSGIGSYSECRKWAGELRQKITKETGLPFTIGLAENKFVSAVAAAHAGIDGEKYIQPGSEKLFLAPLSINNIPLDEKVRETLNRRGIRTMGQLAEMPPGTLQNLFGRSGISVWQKANGICHNAVIPYIDRGSLSSEVVFSRDCRSVPRLLSILSSMSDKLTYSLRKQGMAASSVTVKVRYPDFSTTTRQASVPPVAVGKNLASKAHDLFHILHDATRSVRLIGLRFGGLEQRARQMQLFGGAAEDMAGLSCRNRRRSFSLS